MSKYWETVARCNLPIWASTFEGVTLIQPPALLGEGGLGVMMIRLTSELFCSI